MQLVPAVNQPGVTKLVSQLSLSSETVANIYASDHLIVEPSATVDHVLRQMKTSNNGAALVCEGKKKLLGIFTERDALKLLASEADLQVPIADAMTKAPETMTLSDKVGRAVAKMSSGGFRRLPVVDQAGNALGFVKARHVLHFLIAHFPDVVFNLPPAPHHSTKAREGA